jgi:DNA-binding CsgD family transcriptional regulator
VRRQIEADDDRALHGMYGWPLSAREQQVVGLLADGHDRAAIAARIFVAESTMKKHLYRIYQKLGARNGPHAVHIAHRLGYLAADPAVAEDLKTVRAAREMGYRIAIVPAQEGAA